jgi:hypothetical protein
MAIFKGEREWRRKCREEYEAKQEGGAVPDQEEVDVSPEAPADDDGLDVMSKAELQDYGRNIGLSRVTGLSKGELIDAIRAHLA